MKIVLSVFWGSMFSVLSALAETDTLSTGSESDIKKFRRIRHEVAFGPVGGGNISFLRGPNNTEGTHPLIGLTGGIAFEAGIQGDNVSIYSECMYVEPGYRYKGSLLSTVDKTALLRFPVLMKYKFKPKDEGVSVTVGPYWDRVLHSISKYSFGGTKTKNITKPFEPTVNMGVSAGVGWCHPTGRGIWNLDFRGYYYIGNNHQRFNNTGESVYSFTVTVGYLFKFP